MRRLITAIWAWLRGERRQTKRVDPWDEVNARFIADVERGRALGQLFADAQALGRRVEAEEAAFDAQLALDVPFVSDGPHEGSLRMRRTGEAAIAQGAYVLGAVRGVRAEGGESCRGRGGGPAAARRTARVHAVRCAWQSWARRLTRIPGA